MQFGQITGIASPVSKLILGTMVIHDSDMSAATTLLDAWTTAGGNTLDTAHIYGGGGSERGVGQWMASRKNREKMVIVGKGAHPDGTGPRVRPDAITQDLNESLDRLQTDFIDLYLLHRDDPAVPVGPIVECLHGHREAGRIRAYGGSNWTAERIQEANTYAAEHGLISFAASSPHYSLAVTKEPMWGGCLTLTKAEADWHTKHQFPLLPWSSQAGGFFTGRYAPDVHDNKDVERVYYNDANWERLRRAEVLGREKNATANQIALAWVLHAPFPVFALVGPHSTAELESTLPAVNIALTEKERHWLNLETESK